MHSETNIISEHWETFLKALSDKIAEPSPDHPTARCWTHTSFANVVQDIRRKSLPSTFPHTPEIIAHLIKIGWACRVDVDLLSETSTPSREFYLLDISASHGAKVDPFELLQAYRPDGVICYFSALTYHSLTSQMASFHHIASLIKPGKSKKATYEFRNPDKTDETQISTKKISLGEMLFSYENIPYYLTKRSPSKLVGMQTRILGPRTHIRITTLEQTLLDTLHKPLYCGGASVVLEAWEEGINRFDEERFKEYLDKLSSRLLLRRVGAMFELLEYETSDELKEALEKGLEFFDEDAPETYISLLPGLEFPSLNLKWRVKIP